MPQRLAGTMSLLAFTICLLIGGLGADNTLATAIWRALIAMAGTYLVGLILGVMAQKMLDEHFSSRVAKNDAISGGETEHR